MLYQLLAGPVFIVVYSVSGVVLAVAADAYNRVTLLAVCLALWSAVTLLTGAVSAYWQLAVLRFGLGITSVCQTTSGRSLQCSRIPVIGLFWKYLFWGALNDNVPRSCPALCTEEPNFSGIIGRNNVCITSSGEL